jgi:hypothetical protein
LSCLTRMCERVSRTHFIRVTKMVKVNIRWHALRLLNRASVDYIVKMRTRARKPRNVVVTCAGTIIIECSQ